MMLVENANHTLSCTKSKRIVEFLLPDSHKCFFNFTSVLFMSNHLGKRRHPSQDANQQESIPAGKMEVPSGKMEAVASDDELDSTGSSDWEGEYDPENYTPSGSEQENNSSSYDPFEFHDYDSDPNMKDVEKKIIVHGEWKREEVDDGWYRHMTPHY